MSTEHLQTDWKFLGLWKHLKQAGGHAVELCSWNFTSWVSVELQVYVAYFFLFPPSLGSYFTFFVLAFSKNWLSFLCRWIHNKPRAEQSRGKNNKRKNVKSSCWSSRNAHARSACFYRFQTCTKDLWKEAKWWKMPKENEAVHQLVKCKLRSVKAIWQRLRLG